MISAVCVSKTRNMGQMKAQWGRNPLRCSARDVGQSSSFGSSKHSQAWLSQGQRDESSSLSTALGHPLCLAGTHEHRACVK